MLFCFAEFALLLYGRCHLHHFGLPRAGGHERDTRSIDCAAEHRRMRRCAMRHTASRGRIVSATTRRGGRDDEHYSTVT